MQKRVFNKQTKTNAKKKNIGIHDLNITGARTALWSAPLRALRVEPVVSGSVIRFIILVTP